MKSAHVSPFRLDLMQLGTLPEPERAGVEQHLQSCASCRGLAEAARASREQFARHVLPRGLPQLRRKRNWIPWLALTSAMAFAALLLFVRPRPPDIGIKGAPSFAAFVRRSGLVTSVHDGDHLRAGDEVRFVVVSEELPFVLVCSVDGAGKANVYFPFAGGESGAIELRTRVELPGSIVLDDAPGPERVFALFSARPLATAAVSDALRAIGLQGDSAIRDTKVLPIIADAQSSLVIEKSH